jgi:hypothetical protein
MEPGANWRGDHHDLGQPIQQQIALAAPPGRKHTPYPGGQLQQRRLGIQRRVTTLARVAVSPISVIPAGCWSFRGHRQCSGGVAGRRLRLAHRRTGPNHSDRSRNRCALSLRRVRKGDASGAHAGRSRSCSAERWATCRALNRNAE